MKNTQKSNLQEALFSLRDENYKAFQEKLIPSTNANTVIGVRTPALRRFAVEFADTEECRAFLSDLPHDYYEENCLHGFLIERILDFDQAIAELDRFLPYVDNWATCDMTSPKSFSKNKEKLLPAIEKWISSEHTYMVRFGIVMLMKHYLDDSFSAQYLRMVANIRSEEYYIEMAQAWYFAEALVKQYEATLPYLENEALSPFVHNKTISKACDSFRLDREEKDFLKTLRRKNSK